MLKKAVVAVVVVFILFWLFTDPSGLASVTKDLGGGLSNGAEALFTAIIDFIGDL